MKVLSRKGKRGLLLLLCSTQIGFVGQATAFHPSLGNLERTIGAHYGKTGVAALTGVGAAYGLGKMLWNRSKLHMMERILFDNDDDMGITHKPTKICNWKMEDYPTAGTIVNNQDIFKRDFRAAWNYLAIQHDQSISWRRSAINSINQEITDLQRNLGELARFVFFRPFSCDLIGIDKIFRKSCDRCDINQRKFHENALNPEEEMHLDTVMHKDLKTKTIHFLYLMPNFGKAATLYWTIQKRIQRLQAMRDALESREYRR